MSIESRAVKSVSWLAFFKLISQVVSWGVTIAVARMLVPGDYGLMAMATVITGYAEMFSELGLGAAIIQSPKMTRKETSSVFWFAMGVACFFALFCFVAAPITASLFNEPMVIPLTQVVSVLFLLSGLQIVPLNLLKKELSFKQVGIIEMITTIISCLGMLLIAYLGGGVWTLIGGRMIRGCLKVVLVYMYVDWRPSFHFNLAEAKVFIRFGMVVAVGQSFFYMFEKSDRFFAGRAWPAATLGYYTFALQLAQIPTEKIVSLINQVSFSAFSKLQHDNARFRAFYLKAVKLTAALVFPVFIGGFLLGKELITVLLDDQWLPIVFLFKILCLSQIFTALNAINNFVHNARGKPMFGIYINVLLTFTMTLSFFVAVKYGLSAIVIPWITTYVVVCLFWIFFTAKSLGISVSQYLQNILHPLVATILMALVVLVVQQGMGHWSSDGKWGTDFLALLICVASGGVVYIGYYWLFDRGLIDNMKLLRR